MALMASTLLFLATIACYIIYQRSKPNTKGNKFPGPAGLPLLGNINDLPPSGVPEYQHWLKHKDTLGSVSSVNVMGMTLIIIHDKEAAHDLLDQAAAKTSGRPTMVMANKLCGYGNIPLCQDYTREFVRNRKFLHQELGTKASAAQFQGIQEEEVGRQLARVLAEPDSLVKQFKTTTAATILKAAYGYTVESQKPDVLVETIDRMMAEFSLAAVPMGWAVDIIPALQHLPDGFPGTGFKRTARKWRKSIETSAYVPYKFVRRQMAAGSNKPSYVSKLVEKLSQDGNGDLSVDDEKSVIWTGASLYGAAADTTVITLTAFTLAMIKFPDVQRTAQAEIERVVGTGRLPSIHDREKLPYINAVVKEAIRWWPIAPMGFPHTATEEIQYKGYHIPEGAYLLPAVWWFLHDPSVYPEPESFDPERFLPPRNEPDPGVEAFGYGRRICQGRFFADSGLYLNIVQSLAVFNIGRAVDEKGREMEVDVRPKPGILTYPSEFKSRVSVRSGKLAELIRRSDHRGSQEESDATLLESMAA